MQYVVFEDLQSKTPITNRSDTPVKIHKTTCYIYTNRKTDALTTQWSSEFTDFEDAKECAKQTGKPWKEAECCFK